jgi:hypothetical protein
MGSIQLKKRTPSLQEQKWVAKINVKNDCSMQYKAGY